MKSIKKAIVLLICFAVLLSCAACSGTTATPTTSEPAAASSAEAKPAESAQAESAPAGEKVKITYANWGNADEMKVLQAAVDKFNASQDKIEVEVMQIPHESYIEKLTTLAAAGQLPDSAIMREDAVVSWAQQGMLADISGMYEGSESKPLDCITFKYEGKPVAYSAANEIMCLYYNKDMFDTAGVSYPPTSLDQAWTWDEFVAAAKKLTLDKNGKHPDEAGFDPDSIVQYGCMVENLTWQLEWPCLSNGGGFCSADGSKVTIGDPASIEAIQKVADLYLVDHVAPLSNGTQDDGVQRSLIAKTCAMTTNGTWNVGTCLGAAKKEGLNYGIGVLPYMKNKVTIATGGPNVVFSQSKHPKEAMEWIKWYYQEENNWPLITEGTWMPILDKYYKDETLTHTWVDNPNFPPYEDYKSAVVDVAMNNDVTKSTAWYYTVHSTEFNNLLQSTLGDVWTGKITAQDAITQNLDQLNAAFAGQ